MTNGDFIRAMSDRQLAKLFYQIRYGTYESGQDIVDAMEQNELMVWLAKEIKEIMEESNENR